MMNYSLDAHLTEGASVGAWTIERKTVTKADEQYFQLRAAISYSGRYPPAGAYWGLRRANALDTPDERRDHVELARQARGHVLVNGLGLGLCAGALMELDAVERVTVVEIAEEVIELVGAPLLRRYPAGLEVIHADALEYQPPRGVRFGAVWHDIWDAICSDNLPDMHRLHRKYGRRTDWQGSWCRHLCER